LNKKKSTTLLVGMSKLMNLEYLTLEMVFLIVDDPP